jgi:phenylacetate-CoA ligase
MIKEFALKNTVFKKRLALIEEKKRLYSVITHKDDIESYQIEQFNRVWNDVIINNPFYKMWKDKYNLPSKIKNIDELKDFPILTKKDIQENQDLIFGCIDNYLIISTGGSSGEPTKFPTSKEEQDINYANNYMAKEWWGLNPLDSILLIWGHSHLFGNGLRGKINQYKRVLSDWLINTKRLNAYDMSVDSLESYCEILREYNPKFIIGYTSAIFKLAKYMKENNIVLEVGGQLKGVIVTSETVSQDDVNIIEGVFKVPCIVEYGMAEAGVVSYSQTNSNAMDVFWDSFIVRKDKNNSLLVTTISGKVFPLINYQTDDVIDSNDNINVLNINNIKGRKNDFIKILVDSKIVDVHSEFFTHIMKSIENIINFKLIQKKDLSIEIQYVSTTVQDISSSFFKEVFKEFPKININDFTFISVNDIEKTIAGKSKWIVIER